MTILTCTHCQSSKFSATEIQSQRVRYRCAECGQFSEYVTLYQVDDLYGQIDSLTAEVARLTAERDSVFEDKRGVQERGTPKTYWEWVKFSQEEIVLGICTPMEMARLRVIIDKLAAEVARLRGALERVDEILEHLQSVEELLGKSWNIEKTRRGIENALTPPEENSHEEG